MLFNSPCGSTLQWHAGRGMMCTQVQKTCKRRNKLHAVQQKKIHLFLAMSQSVVDLFIIWFLLNVTELSTY